MKQEDISEWFRQHDIEEIEVNSPWEREFLLLSV
jgi:hypothetical protein